MLISLSRNLIIKSERKSNSLHVDMSRDFINETFKPMLKKYNFKTYCTYNEVKSAIIEH